MDEMMKKIKTGELELEDVEILISFRPVAKENENSFLNKMPGFIKVLMKQDPEKIHLKCKKLKFKI